MSNPSIDRRVVQFITMVLLTALLVACGQAAQAPTPAPAAQPTKAAAAAPQPTTAPAKQAAAPSGDKIILKFPHHAAPTEVVGQTADELAKLIAQKTNGRVEVQVFPAGQLGGEKESLEGLQLGTFDMSFIAAELTANAVPVFGVFPFPFMFRDLDHAYKVMDGPIAAELSDQLLKEKNLRILSWWDAGFRSVYSKKGPINNADDFKGLKIRSPESEVFIKTFRALGANATPVPFPEVYNALQTNLVDAAEGPISLGYANKWHEVTKFVSKTYHVFTVWTPMIRDQVYQSMPADVQKQVMEAVKEATASHRNRMNKVNAETDGLLEAAGVTINDVPDKSTLQAAVKPVWEEMGAKIKAEEIIKKIQDTK